jgi:hypothetical protein
VTRQTIPCLSVRQPWADLIVTGIKDVENRTWPTDLRGKLLIHAPKTVDWAAVTQLHHWLPASELKTWLGRQTPDEYQPTIAALLGITEVVDCVTHHPSRFFSGPFGFVLQHSRPFAQPIPYRGRLGIFPVPTELLDLPAEDLQF